MTEVRGNGVDIAYQSLDGDPAILLIHGLGTPLTGWPSSLCDGLAAKGFRVVRFDNRDVGRSTFFRQFGAPDIGAMMATLRSGGAAGRALFARRHGRRRSGLARRAGN